MNRLKAEVMLATCNDQRFPPSAMLESDPKTFYVTTGLYPHEIVIGFNGKAVNVSRISLTSHAIRTLRFEKTTETNPVNFEALVDCELNHSEMGKQVEQFEINRGTVGNSIRFLKLVIGSGHDQFATVFDLAVEGEELD